MKNLLAIIALCAWMFGITGCATPGGKPKLEVFINQGTGEILVGYVMGGDGSIAPLSPSETKCRMDSNRYRVEEVFFPPDQVHWARMQAVVDGVEPERNPPKIPIVALD